MSIYAACIVQDKRLCLVSNNPPDKTLKRMIKACKQSFKERDQELTDPSNGSYVAYIIEGAISYLCAYQTPSKEPSDRAFQFLTSLQQSHQGFANGRTLKPADHSAFQPTLMKLIVNFTTIDVSIAANLNNKADQIKEKLIDATEKQLHMNDETANIEEEAKEMKEGAHLLMKNAQEIKEEAKRQALCCFCSKACMIVSILLAVAIVALIVLYFIFWRKRTE
jgi:predicted ribosome quality control (RQC) complex YloA/Tae2 family protein